MSLSVTSVGLAGCGDDDDTGDDDDDAVDGGDDDDDATSVLHDCNDADFVDATASDGDRTIAFAGVAYTPPCLTIAAGQTVTWEGTFSSHPLSAGVAPSRDGDPEGTAGNPIPDTNSGDSVDVTFDDAGDFPFYCTNHQGAGMFGVIRVE